MTPTTSYIDFTIRKTADREQGVRLDVVVCVLLLATLIIPTNTLSGAMIMVLKWIKYIACGWAIILFISKGYYKDKDLLPVWLLLLSTVVATLVSLHGFVEMISFCYPIFTVVVLAKYLLELKGYQGIVYISIMFSTLLVIQAVSGFIGGFGIAHTINSPYVNYFFGLRIRISDIYIFAVALAIIVASRGGAVLKAFGAVAIASGIFFIFFEQVSTAIGATLVSILVFAVSMIVRYERMWRRLAVLALICALLYVFAAGNTDLFQWFYADILGESTTLDGRTLIWEQALEQMDGWHWVFGYGFDNGHWFYLGNNWMANTAHSQYLDLLFYFGVLGLAPYLLMLVKQLSVTQFIENHGYKSLVIATIVGLIFTGIPTTTFRAVYMYIFYVIVCALPALLSEDSKDGTTIVSKHVKARDNYE